jgi:succinate dehydrogenase hydrophobic anchor subunit
VTTGVVLLLVELLVVVLLLLVARRQRSRHNNWANDAANPRQHEMFVLFCIDSSIHTNMQS